MAKLSKCPNGHFYNADIFPECPYCPSQPRQQADPNRTAPLRGDPPDPGRTAPLQNGQWGAFPDPNKTAPAQNWQQPYQQPAQAGPVNKLVGLLDRIGGWRRLLAIAAAVVMLIYTVGTFSEGRQSVATEEDGFWSSEYVAYRHEEGNDELIIAAASAALFLCAAAVVWTKGKSPAAVAAAAAALAVIVFMLFRWSDCITSYDLEHYGFDFGFAWWFYLPPPVLSFLALLPYWFHQKKAA